MIFRIHPFYLIEMGKLIVSVVLNMLALVGFFLPFKFHFKVINDDYFLIASALLIIASIILFILSYRDIQKKAYKQPSVEKLIFFLRILSYLIFMMDFLILAFLIWFAWSWGDGLRL